MPSHTAVCAAPASAGITSSTCQAAQERYHCQPGMPEFESSEQLTGPNGFFRFGPNVVCYGQSTLVVPSPTITGRLFDASKHVCTNRKTIGLPFDANQVIDNLRYERYMLGSGWRLWAENGWIRDIYYQLRPLFPVWFRKHLQRVYLRDWQSLPFPAWPVDTTVEMLLEKLLVQMMRAVQIDRLPFIWFWPEGHAACAILTHDVETTKGRDFCDELMGIDDDFSIKASFQVVPEKRYAVPASFLQTIRDRGFEVNVQGLNHDGNLFRNRETFLKESDGINRYAKQYGAQGFRSPVLYRNVDWFQDLNFSYDMSVPNVARLEAQRGGCCTVMPYSLPGGMTELPLTVTEDYTLFNVLNDYSTTLWKQQMKIILESRGLMTFLIHPDYVTTGRAQDTYKALLAEIDRLRSDHRVWVTLPRDVDRWWRDRNAMTLVPSDNGWKIEGPGSERARVAYAILDGDRLGYEV